MTTIWIAHTTFSTAFVAIVIASRLREMDESVEEAALDLGARPAKVFFVITLPIIAPALLSGWLLAFTLSLDDLVIASFVSGPGIDHAADGRVFQCAPGCQSENQCAGDDHYLLVSVGILVAGLLMARMERHKRELRNVSTPS